MIRVDYWGAVLRELKFISANSPLKGKAEEPRIDWCLKHDRAKFSYESKGRKTLRWDRTDCMKERKAKAKLANEAARNEAKRLTKLAGTADFFQRPYGKLYKDPPKGSFLHRAEKGN